MRRTTPIADRIIALARGAPRPLHRKRLRVSSYRVAGNPATGIDDDIEAAAAHDATDHSVTPFARAWSARRTSSVFASVAWARAEASFSSPSLSGVDVSWCSFAVLVLLPTNRNHPLVEVVVVDFELRIRLRLPKSGAVHREGDARVVPLPNPPLDLAEHLRLIALLAHATPMRVMMRGMLPASVARRTTRPISASEQSTCKHNNTTA